MIAPITRYSAEQLADADELRWLVAYTELLLDIVEARCAYREEQLFADLVDVGGES